MKRYIFYSLVVLLLFSCGKEKEAWQRAKEENTVESYQQYLDDFQDGKYSETAQFKIDSIQNAEDSLAWIAALEINSISAFESYLSDFENGKYSDEAEDMIEKLKKEQEIKPIDLSNSDFDDFRQKLMKFQGKTFIQTFLQTMEQNPDKKDESPLWATAYFLTKLYQTNDKDSLIVFFSQDSCLDLLYSHKVVYPDDYSHLLSYIDWLAYVVLVDDNASVISGKDWLIKQLIFQDKDSTVIEDEDGQSGHILKFNFIQNADNQTATIHLFLQNFQFYNDSDEGSEDDVEMKIIWKKIDGEYKIVGFYTYGQNAG